MIILFAVLGAFWRAWFGGSFGSVTRFWKYLALIFICCTMYLCKYPYFTFWLETTIWLTQISFMVFWAMSHGDYFIVNSTAPDEKRIKWIDKILEWIYGKDGYYNFKGNVTGMLLRYGFTAIIVACCIPNPWFLLAGPCVAACYGLSGYLFPDKWYTKIAEFASGAIVFSLLYLCL